MTLSGTATGTGTVKVNDGSSDIITLSIVAGNTYEVSAETAAVAANMTVTPSFT